MNNDIKDKVYINGKWINDHFLTDAKNDELINVRKDLTEVINEEVSLINTNIDDIDSKVSNLSTSVSAIKENVTNINGDITELQEKSDELDTRITSELTSIQDTVADSVLAVKHEVGIESNRAIAKENELTDALNAEISARSNAIANTHNNINAINQNIADNYYNKEETISQIAAQIKEITGDNVDEAFDTLKEIADWISHDEAGVLDLTHKINILEQNKVDKDGNKKLSTNDFTDELKLKLQNLNKDANKNVQADWAEKNDLSDAYIRNKPNIENLHLYETVNGLNKDGSVSQYALKQQFDNVQQNIDAVQSSIDGFNDDLKGYVQRIHGKDLSTNDFTTEYKEKIDNLNTTYEVIENKKTSIPDASITSEDNTFPTVKAVQEYVNKNKINTSTFLDKESSESQLVTSTVAFKNFSIQEQENINGDPHIIRLKVEENGNLIIRHIDGENYTDATLDVAKIGINSIIYNGKLYTIYDDDNTSENNQLVTYSKVEAMLDELSFDDVPNADLILEDRTAESITELTLDKTKYIKFVLPNDKDSSFTVNVPTKGDAIKYMFSFKTGINIPNLIITDGSENISLPFNFEFAPYMEYICKIINGKAIILSQYDIFNYPQFYNTGWIDLNGYNYIYLNSDLSYTTLDESTGETTYRDIFDIAVNDEDQKILTLTSSNYSISDDENSITYIRPAGSIGFGTTTYYKDITENVITKLTSSYGYSNTTNNTQITITSSSYNDGIYTGALDYNDGSSTSRVDYTIDNYVINFSVNNTTIKGTFTKGYSIINCEDGSRYMLALIV